MVQFSCVFSQWCFLQKKHIFQCGQCKMQTLECSPGVVMQTEGKMPTEVLLYVNSKQTNLMWESWFSLNSSRVRLNTTRISWEGSRRFGWFIWTPSILTWPQNGRNLISKDHNVKNFPGETSSQNPFSISTPGLAWISSPVSLFKLSIKDEPVIIMSAVS